MRRAVSQVLKIASGFPSSLLASLRFVIALDVVLLLFWILGELTYSLYESAYSPLALFFGITLIATLSIAIWRCWKPQHFGGTAAYSDNLNILPITILDVIVIVAAVFVSDQLHKPLATPLFHFSQSIMHEFIS